LLPSSMLLSPSPRKSSSSYPHFHSIWKCMWPLGTWVAGLGSWARKQKRDLGSHSMIDLDHMKRDTHTWCKSSPFTRCPWLKQELNI
jgi:hypothetical protein